MADSPTSPAARILTGVQDSGLAALVRDSDLLYPVLQVAHIAGFALLVGAVAMFDLRVLGCSKRVPVDDLARHLLPWAVGALLVIVPSGLLLFTADALAYVSNRAFVLKLCLIFVAGCNAAAFHLGPLRTVAAWRIWTSSPIPARLHALASLALWVAVLACGRFIAFV
jgi:hypothetical protein